MITVPWCFYRLHSVHLHFSTSPKRFPGNWYLHQIRPNVTGENQIIPTRKLATAPATTCTNTTSAPIVSFSRFVETRLEDNSLNFSGTECTFGVEKGPPYMQPRFLQQASAIFSPRGLQVLQTSVNFSVILLQFRAHCRRTGVKWASVATKQMCCEMTTACIGGGL